MEVEVLDTRGFSCPEPVIRTKNKIANITNGELEILVDTEVARDNVSRLLKKEGWQVEVKEEGEDYRLLVTK